MPSDQPDDESPKRKIVRLFKKADAKASGRPEPSAGGNVVRVSGANNIAAGRDVHIHNGPPPQPPRRPVTPGVDHVSVEQRRVLKELVAKVVVAEAALKRKPKGFSAIYTALNRHFHVKALEEIPLSGFEEARLYLLQWLGRLNSMPTAAIKTPDEWRRSRYTYIKVNSKSDEEATAVSAYIKRNFNAESLTELSNDELERTYRYVAGRKRRKT